MKTCLALMGLLTLAACIEENSPKADDARVEPEPQPAPTAEPPQPEPQPAPTAAPIVEPEPAPQPEPPPQPEPNPGPAIPPFREPAQHRAFPEMCDAERPPGAMADPDEGECTQDSDCVDGVNGRCVRGRFPTCTYDECFSDAECANAMGGGVCACEGSWIGQANSCYDGNCQVDLDCATGYCSPSFGDCGDYFGYQSYWCHTFEDECVDDADCADLPGGYCAFMPQLGRWACSNSHCDGK